jgi:acyl carrier protein
MTEHTAPRPSGPAQIEAWLIERAAFYLELPAEDIAPDRSLADYGLDSVYAFVLCGEIEETLDIAVEPTLLWDVDTISALTAHLAESTAARPRR